MIKEFESYHGSVLSHLLHATNKDVTLKVLAEYGNAAYLIDKTVVLYIKHSTKRLTPWSFSFSYTHHADIVTLYKQFHKTVVALVCKNDGIVALDFEEFQHLVGIPSKKGAWITCSRKRREMYAVKGSAGELSTKINDGHLNEKLFQLQRP